MKPWIYLAALLAFLALDMPVQQPLQAQSRIMPGLQRSCEAGDSEDCWTLARNYGVMSGLRKNCNGNDEEACAKLKTDYPGALPAEATLIQKYNFYRDRACTLRSEEVCRQIGNSYLGYSWATGSADKRKALEYFSKACQIDSSSHGCDPIAQLTQEVGAEDRALKPTGYDKAVFLEIETMLKRYVYSRYYYDDHDLRYVEGSLTLGAGEGDRQRGIIHFTARLQSDRGEITTSKMNAIYAQGSLRCVDTFDVETCQFTYLTQEMAERQHAAAVAHRQKLVQQTADALRATALKLPGARLNAEDRACIVRKSEERTVSVPRCTSTEVDPSSHEPYCASRTYVESTETFNYTINQCKRPLYFVFKCGSLIVDNGPTQPGQRLRYDNSYCEMVYPDKK